MERCLIGGLFPTIQHSPQPGFAQDTRFAHGLDIRHSTYRLSWHLDCDEGLDDDRVFRPAVQHAPRRAPTALPGPVLTRVVQRPWTVVQVTRLRGKKQRNTSSQRTFIVKGFPREAPDLSFGEGPLCWFAARESLAVHLQTEEWSSLPRSLDGPVANLL